MAGVSITTQEPRWTAAEYERRPRLYEPLLADHILERIRNGEMLTSICKNNPDMPLPGTFLAWVADDSALESEYKRARKIGVDVTFDAMVEEARSGLPDAGVRANALKHYTERMHPEKYGPRQMIRQTKETDDTGGGIDYTASSVEVRRKLAQMAERRAAREPGETQ